MWAERGKLQQIMFLHENRKRSFDHAAEVFFNDEVPLVARFGASFVSTAILLFVALLLPPILR